jgi:hypothetical protein
LKINTSGTGNLRHQAISGYSVNLGSDRIWIEKLAQHRKTECPKKLSQRRRHLEIHISIRVKIDD